MEVINKSSGEEDRRTLVKVEENASCQLLKLGEKMPTERRVIASNFCFLSMARPWYHPNLILQRKLLQNSIIGNIYTEASGNYKRSCG